MNHYDTYKPSGIDWIGDVPSHWEMKRLKYSCCFYGRIGFRGYTQADLVGEDEGAITLSPSNMNNMYLDFSKCSYLSWKKYHESPEIKVYPGDVLLVKTASVGKCTYVDKIPKECTVNPQILVLKEHNDNPKFITYFFHTPIGQSYIDCYKVGSTIPTISEEKIGAFRFVFPPLSEQEAIASYLDKRCGEIDKVITTQERRIELLREMKQSIITRAVTKGINPNANMKDSGAVWIDKIPSHWEIVPLKRKARVILGKMLQSVPKQDSDSLENYICAKDVHFEGIDTADLKQMYFSPSEKELYKVKRNDMLIVEGGAGAGGCATVKVDINDTYIQNSIMIVRGNDELDNQFISYYFESIAKMGYIDMVTNVATIPHFSKEKVEETLMPIPPKEEQLEILEYISKRTKPLAVAMVKAQREIELLRELKQATITEVVTGKRKVC